MSAQRAERCAIEPEAPDIDSITRWYPVPAGMAWMVGGRIRTSVKALLRWHALFHATNRAASGKPASTDGSRARCSGDGPPGHAVRVQRSRM